MAMPDPYDMVSSVPHRKGPDERKHATRAPAHKEGAAKNDYQPDNAKQKTPSFGTLGVRGGTNGK